MTNLYPSSLVGLSKWPIKAGSYLFNAPIGALVKIKIHVSFSAAPLSPPYLLLPIKPISSPMLGEKERSFLWPHHSRELGQWPEPKKRLKNVTHKKCCITECFFIMPTFSVRNMNLYLPKIHLWSEPIYDYCISIYIISWFIPK